VNILNKSRAVELAPDRIRVCGLCPVMGEIGLLETFMGMPDTPENRAKFIPAARSAASRGRTTSRTRPFTSPPTRRPPSPA
jgi:hypothetical protein